MRTRGVVGAGGLLALFTLAGCEGYNLQLGTSASNLANFHVVYEMPATSLRPWSERSAPVAIPPPEDDSSGVSTLPPSSAALPPERPAPAASGSR
jgi:hypothetical protein